MKIWPAGSLEEKVQNLVKTWEMENFHKACIDDFTTLDPKKFTFCLNGTFYLTSIRPKTPIFGHVILKTY